MSVSRTTEHVRWAVYLEEGGPFGSTAGKCDTFFLPLINRVRFFLFLSPWKCVFITVFVFFVVEDTQFFS